MSLLEMRDGQLELNEEVCKKKCKRLIDYIIYEMKLSIEEAFIILRYTTESCETAIKARDEARE